jgi:hypothetical protein
MSDAPSRIDEELNLLLAAATERIDKHGSASLRNIEAKSELFLGWVDYLEAYHLTRTADSLLISARASVRECGAYLAFGLVRSALFALRNKIDLALSWCYFKDHPVEWRNVNQTGEGFKLKQEILKYLGAHIPDFSRRFAILLDIATRKESEPYRLLSAHIHGQSSLVLPNFDSLSDLVSEPDICNECESVVAEVDEYLNDLFLAIFAKNWVALPEVVRVAAENRFKNEAQLKNFFS